VAQLNGQGTSSRVIPKLRRTSDLSSTLLAVSLALRSINPDPQLSFAEPLTQIVGGVALLLAGVLNLLGNLLSGLGLDSLLKGIVAATVNIFTLSFT
jgi:hypothetical protein